MSDVNTKSKRFSLPRSSKVPPQEQGWSLRCLCGTDLTGFREEGSQKIVCPNCERVHFILPLNTYPHPKRTRKKRKRRQGEPLRKIAFTKIKNAGGAVRKGVRNLFVKTGRGIAASLLSLLTKIRNWFTPLRIAASLLIILLSFGGYYGYRQQSRAKALQTLRESITRAEQALEQEKWAEATEQFQLAAEAVKLLGRNDQFAWQVLQKNRELQAIDGLCALSLEDIIHSAAGKGSTTLTWQTEFKTMVQNRWLVMESWVLLDASESKSEAILAHSISIDDEKVNIIWPTSLFSPLNSEAELHVLSAGQIESVERSDDPRFDWAVKIRPESAFLWCFDETISPLGFELDSQWFPEDSIRALLTRQRRLAGAAEGDNQ